MKAITPQTKTAIVLFNLGGPDRPESVEPFLFNLFNDPAIIGAPKWIRYGLARFISSRRAPVAREIYENLGGKSPIVEQTQEQADALEAALADAGQVKAFMCMRYWHPMSEEVAQRVKAYAPDHVILLPLYPQFSTTTSGSSIKEWHRVAKQADIHAPHTTICCYPLSEPFIASHVQTIRSYINQAREYGTPRLLFSAHGLPEKIIRQGDPYQWQVEQTVKAVSQQLDADDCEILGCYQSRVGPLKWIGPSTEDEIKRAGADKRPIVVIPIAFVSEHSETLVELDIEYRELADHAGVPGYFRVPALGTQSHFIRSLAELCAGVETDHTICSHAGGRICPQSFIKCPQGIAA